MTAHTRVLLIVDIEPFILKTLPLVKIKAFEHGVQIDDVDYFFDWAINQLLIENFNISVIHHYRHDVYLCMYHELKNDLLKSLMFCINRFDIDLLKGCEVKTLINGRDLFITRRSSYVIF